MLTTAATPWDCLLRQPAMRLVPRADTDEPMARPGTKLSRLLDVLAERGSCTTLTLSACTDLESRAVWGLLKTPRAIGQVEFIGGRWSLVQGFAGRDVERAAALLRDLGWRVEPPSGSSSAGTNGATGATMTTELRANHDSNPPLGLGCNEGLGRAAQDAAAVFEQAANAAMEGQPRPTEPPLAVQGWDCGDAKRRIRAGEAIGMVCQGTKCDACGEQNWGWRLCCRCNTTLEAQTVRYGLLVDDGLPEGACAKFMTVDDVRATGKPLIDTFTGATVALPA